jgi:tripartite-type tricarboxylate transporter receptor subunit TctC
MIMKALSNRPALAHKLAIFRVAAAAGMLLVGTMAFADDFPSKPIRIIAPAPPGATTDSLARLLAHSLNESAKWTVVVENIAGAGGNIGFENTLKAPKDGHTLALGEPSNMIVNQFIYKRIPFNVEKDVQPVTLVAKVPLILVVAATSPHTSAESLLAAGKKKPLTFASGGNGTMGHVAAVLWAEKTGVGMQHIPYKGSAPAMTDLIGGQTDFFFTTPALALPMIQGGKVRALAVTSAVRLPTLKDVPTIAEAGTPGMEVSAVFGVVGPAGMPPAALARLSSELNKVLLMPAVAEKLLAMGADRRPGTFGGDPASFQKLLQAERAKWGPVVKAAGVTVD